MTGKVCSRPYNNTGGLGGIIMEGKVRTIKDGGGYSLIELIISMAIIALLGSALFTMISSGGRSYQRIQKNYTSQNDARVALSYVTVKIRQNDRVYVDPAGVITSGISVSGNIIRITDPSHTDMYWWIYRQGEKLMEQYGNGMAAGGGTEIAAITGFTAEQLTRAAPEDPLKLKIAIEYDDGSGAPYKELNEIISLRADNP